MGLGGITVFVSVQCMSVFVFVSAQLLCTSSASVSVLLAIKTTRLKAKTSSQRTQNSEHRDDVVIKDLWSGNKDIVTESRGTLQPKSLENHHFGLQRHLEEM